MLQVHSDFININGRHMGFISRANPDTAIEPLTWLIEQRHAVQIPGWWS